MLKKEQKLALEEIFSSNLATIATWGGGTALSEIYLHHRRSDDIDIILADLPPLTELTILANKIKKSLAIKTTKSLVKMNRFQYFFDLPNNQLLKLEFVYYPFPKLDHPKKIGKIKVESLLDIAVAKTLTAYQRQEVKDAFDLYILLKNKHFTLKKLVKGVEQKFGETIDPRALLAKLVENLKTFKSLKPMMIGKKYHQKDLLDFLQQEFNRYMK